MLVFNCTKAAAEFFTITKKGEKNSPIETAPHKTIAQSIANEVLPNDIIAIDGPAVTQWHWLVHAIKVKRKNVLIVMDYHSRFAITLTGLKKGDQYPFLNMFEHHLTVHIHELMSLVCDDSTEIENSLENYNSQHDSCAFHQRGDRSVQTHINDVKWHFECLVDERGEIPTEVDLIGFDDHVNSMIRKRNAEKDYFEPRHAFLQHWLSEYGELTEQQAAKEIIDLKNQERAMYQAQHEIVQHKIEQEHIDRFVGQSKEIISPTNNVVSLDSYRTKKAKS
ncbi:MAG: hypothetical protein JKX67_12065 [Colwellia sp.]|nr:hypothetical protein [Colwellia sp.]